ncbi:hypothetical protein M8J75_007281 [Diaphorina citri]|nr:hypothetical protein M8J75_007281 [Diaphorina citri]
MPDANVRTVFVVYPSPATVTNLCQPQNSSPNLITSAQSLRGPTMCDRLTSPRSASPVTLTCVTGLSNEL